MAVASQAEYKEVQETVKNIIEYITAMRIELERKKLQNAVRIIFKLINF